MTREQLVKNAKFFKVKQLSDAIHHLMREQKQTAKQALELSRLVAQRAELMATMPLTRVK